MKSKKNNKIKNKTRNNSLKTEKEIKEALLNLEDEYRKAIISEKDYKAIKEKYSKELNRMKSMVKKDPPKEKKEKKDKLEVGEIEEVTPEVIEKLATQLSEQPETEEEEKKKKSGIFGKLFGKKKKEVQETSSAPISEETMAEQTDEESESYSVPMLNKKIGVLEVEIEKLKTMLETVRETGHVTDETIQTISESIGELRSLIFQTDASLKETMIKMEKIEDDISGVKPREITKKFTGYNIKIEKHDLEIEKLQRKSEDANEKLNKIYDVIKSIGGIENLVNINKKIQEKLKDVEEAVKYIGRIGAKTERQFMDLSRGLDDLILFKAKQEDIDESLKDIIKSIDALNVKFESYVSKKDMNVFKEDILLIKKQLENVNKVLPLVELKLPEIIIDLRKEREDILLLLDSLQEQYENKKISKEEYESFKTGNEKRLGEIEAELKEEWKKVEKMLKLSKEEKKEEVPKPEEKKEKPKLEKKEKKEKEVEEKIEKKPPEKEVPEVEEKIEKVPKEEKPEIKPEKVPEVVKKEIELEKEVEEIPEKKVKIKEKKKKVKEKKVEKAPEKIEKPKKEKEEKEEKKRPTKKKKKGRKLKILSEIKKMEI